VFQEEKKCFGVGLDGVMVKLGVVGEGGERVVGRLRVFGIIPRISGL